MIKILTWFRRNAGFRLRDSRDLNSLQVSLRSGLCSTHLGKRFFFYSVCYPTWTVNFQSSLWFPWHFLAAERKQESCLWGLCVLSLCSEDFNKNPKCSSSAEQTDFLLKRQCLCFGHGKRFCLFHLERNATHAAPRDDASRKAYLLRHIWENIIKWDFFNISAVSPDYEFWWRLLLKSHLLKPSSQMPLILRLKISEETPTISQTVLKFAKMLKSTNISRWRKTFCLKFFTD